MAINQAPFSTLLNLTTIKCRVSFNSSAHHHCSWRQAVTILPYFPISVPFISEWNVRHTEKRGGRGWKLVKTKKKSVLIVRRPISESMVCKRNNMSLVSVPVSKKRGRWEAIVYVWYQMAFFRVIDNIFSIGIFMNDFPLVLCWLGQPSLWLTPIKSSSADRMLKRSSRTFWKILRIRGLP